MISVIISPSPQLLTQLSVFFFWNFSYVSVGVKFPKLTFDDFNCALKYFFWVVETFKMAEE